ncbi:MAG: phage tail family protein [Candidatus Omnitrophica bacterium]|nr:phage tail family protein [Candidatus Omnitrophota bacterium]
MADSMSFGGIDLSSSTYGLTVVDGPIQVLAQPRLSKSERVGGHGSVVRGSYIGERIITVPVVVEGSSHSDMLVKVDALRNLFRPGLDQNLALDYWPGRNLKCRLSRSVEGKVYGGRALEMSLEFIAGDPVWYGTTLRTRTITNSGSFTDWRASLGGTPYSGSADTPITFIGHQGPSDSAYAVLYVENTMEAYTSVENRWGVTSGADNYLPYRMGANLYCKFNSDLETISVSADQVIWTSIMAYRSVTYTPGSNQDPYILPTMATLHPGENQFACTGLSGTGYTWTYYYYDRWL